jgi:thiol:disulfide interchange protein DsbC
MIDKNGKIVTPYIVDKKVVKDAVAFTFGNGKEDLYIVTDPECPFCRELEKEKGDILKKKYKIHVILYPLEEIHPDSKKMIEYILSQPKNKQVQTFVNVLTGKDNKWENFEPTEKQIQKTEEYLKKSQKAFQELRATGTPSVYDKDFNLVNPANLK